MMTRDLPVLRRTPVIAAESSDVIAQLLATKFLCIGDGSDDRDA
jgi:hypothetical protein